MISIVFLLSLLWLGLILDEEFAISRGDLLLRGASAIMLGCFWGTWLVYLLAWCFGFQLWTVIAATGLIVFGNAMAWRKRGRDLAWLRSLCTIDRQFWRTYFAFPLLLLVFFIFEVWVNPAGDILYRGNFTDLAFHMGTVSAFLEQTAFPPLNPQSATAKLSYHFMADFHSAILCRGGFSLFYSLKVPMVMFAFSLGALTAYFFHHLLRKSAAGVSACILFLLGHIGVFNFLYGLLGYPVGNEPFSLTSWTSIEDHLTFPYFNFLNVMVDFFQPQLAFLFGFPFALLILLVLFRKFSRPEPADRTTYFVVASVALLPLFHMHSFLVLMPLVGLFLLGEWWTMFATARLRRAGGIGGVAASPFRIRPYVSAQVLAVVFAGLALALQFAFILSQKKSPGFSGFDVSAKLGALTEIPNFLHARRLWFWVRVVGPPLLLGLGGFLLPATFRIRATDADRRANLAFLALFAVTGGYFVVINFYRFTPSWGDNNKFFLYWDLILCLYAGRLLARFWAASRAGRVAVVVALLLGAILPSAVEWNLRYKRGPSTLFTASDQIAADWIKLNTPKDAVFLTANSYTHYVTALAGRRVVNGAYTRETGFADNEIETQVARAYREADPSDVTGVRVTHIVVGPDERNLYHLSRPMLARRQKLLFDEISRGLRYSVYEVREVPAAVKAADRQKEDAKGFNWLSELDPQSVHQFGNLQYDESFDQAPIALNGHSYGAGLGTHAPSEIKFDLDGKYTSFDSDVGVDDTQGPGVGSVIFRVKVDDNTAFTSHVLRGAAPRETVHLDLTDAQTLTLIVEDAGDGNHNDHADWAGAKLVLKPQ